MVTSNKPPQRRLQGIRASIPAGYLLGRVSGGEGDVELISLAAAQANGLVPSKLPPSGPAGGDLSGTYPNPTVAALRGILLNTTAPTLNYVLTYDGVKASWLPAPGVLTGSGVPVSLQAAGTLYSRTDTADVYSSQPIAGSISIVQHKSIVSTTNVPGSTPLVMTSAPVAGNLLLAFIPFGDNNSVIPTINTASWTLFQTIAGTGSNIRGFAVYRYAQIGDTTSLPAFCTAGGNYWSAVVYEISHVSGVFANDVPLSQGAGQTGSVTQTTTGQLTVHANDIVLIAGGNYNGNTNPTISAGWTSDESQHNASFFGSVVGGSQIVASPSTISGTLTFDHSANSVTAFQVVVANLGSSTPAWTLIGPAPISTQQVFTSGSALTYTTPAGCRQIKVTIKAAGGGGAAASQSGAAAGSDGSDSIFNSIHAAAGKGGTTSQTGGAGGTGGTGVATLRIPGFPGCNPIDLVAAANAGSVALAAGNGGGPGAGIGTYSANGTAAAANSGSGGGGGGGGGVLTTAGSFASTTRAGGGGEGETAILIINNPAGTYTYTVGTGGTGAAAALLFAAGNGAAGKITVDEYY